MTKVTMESPVLVYRGPGLLRLLRRGPRAREGVRRNLCRLPLAGSAAEVSHVHRPETRPQTAVDERTLCRVPPCRLEPNVRL